MKDQIVNNFGFVGHVSLYHIFFVVVVIFMTVWKLKMPLAHDLYISWRWAINCWTPDADAALRAHRGLLVGSFFFLMASPHSCLGCLMTWHLDPKRKPCRQISPNGQVFIKPPSVSCLLMSHWPNMSHGQERISGRGPHSGREARRTIPWGPLKYHPSHELTWR